MRAKLSSSLVASSCSASILEGHFLCWIFRSANLFSMFLMSISLSFLSRVAILIILPLIATLWAAQSTSGEMFSTLLRRKYSFREFSVCGIDGVTQDGFIKTPVCPRRSSEGVSQGEVDQGMVRPGNVNDGCLVR